MNRMLYTLSLLVAAAALSSCAGIGFESAWEKAVEDRRTGKSSAVTGPWTGTWLSHHNSHTGDLRCLVTPVEGSENLHHFRYHATWGRFFQGGFKADYEVVSENGAYTVDGTKDIGPFGSFEHLGRIEGDRFDASYQSTSGDHGVFEMKRPVVSDE